VLPKVQVRGAAVSCSIVMQCLRNVNKYLPVMRVWHPSSAPHFSQSHFNDYQRNALRFTFRFSNQNTVYEGWNFNSGNYLFATDTK